jgi:hypothetical protein
MNSVTVSPALVTRRHQMECPIVRHGQSSGVFLEIFGNVQSAGSFDLTGRDLCVNRCVIRQGHTQTPCFLCSFSPVTPSKVKRPLEKLDRGERGTVQRGNRRPGRNIGKMVSQGHNGSRPIGTGHRDPLIRGALQSLEISRTAGAGGRRGGSFRELARRGGRGAPDFHSPQNFWNRESNSGVVDP